MNKKKLNSKDELIKSLINTLIAILNNRKIQKKPKKKRKEKKKEQVEPRTILTPVEQKNILTTKMQYMLETQTQTWALKTSKLFGLKSTVYLRTAMFIPIKSTNRNNWRSCLHNNSCLHNSTFVINSVTLNGLELKGTYLFTEDAKVKPLAPLRFTNNNPDLGNNIDNREESHLHVDFKRFKNSKQISIRRLLNVRS